MMRVIAADDEKLSLMRIERILGGIPGVEFVAGYQNPGDVLAHQREDAADIAFLDVEMPDMDGIALCERLTEANPNLEVVFVTAHEKYALSAYKTNAIGYLLKPVQPEDVKKQVERIQRYKPAIKPAPGGTPCIKVFGSFYVTDGSNEVLKFRTEKAEELLALLVNQRRKPISRDMVCSLLWPDMSVERATRNFHTTAYNIRHTFGEAGLTDVLGRAHESYCLNAGHFHNDLDVFCTALDTKEDNPAYFERLEKSVSVFEGVYMSGRDYIWLSEYQAFYEREFEKLCFRLCGEYEKRGEPEKAKITVFKLLKINPTCEDACARLLTLCRERGETAEAKSIYENFQNSYRAEFGEEPSTFLKSLL